MRPKFLITTCFATFIPTLVWAQPAPIPYSVDTHMRSAAPTVVVPRIMSGAPTLEVQTQRPDAGPFVTVEKLTDRTRTGFSSSFRDTTSASEAL